MDSAVSFRLRRQTLELRKPRSRTDNPVADVKADAKADAKEDAKEDVRTMNVVLLLVAVSMPDSADLHRRADSVVLVRPLAELYPRAASASATLLRLHRQASDLRAASVDSAALDRRVASASEF